MTLTSRESQVVQLLKQRQVAAYAELADQLKVSGKTVQRALHKAGTYASLNANSAYVTLKNIPRFDSRGLWGYKQLRFSRHGDLSRTIQALIEQSPQGCTVSELQQWLGTRVHNHLSRLLRRGEIQRSSLGRHALYISADPAQQQRQQAARQPSPTTGGDRPAAQEVPPLPAGVQPLELIRLLLQMLHKPAASPASLAKSCRPKVSPSAPRKSSRYGILRSKKNDTLKTAALFHKYRDYWQSTWQNVRIPGGLCHRFDQPATEGMRVQKTVRRQVVTWELSGFQSLEVVRTGHDHQVRRSPRLAALVPKGGKYGYDLIARVGVQTFLEGRALQAVAAELRPLNIPFSSLHDMALKFLYYFGLLHQRYAAPLLATGFSSGEERLG